MSSKMSGGRWTSRNSQYESRRSRSAASFTTSAWRLRAGVYAWHSGPHMDPKKETGERYP